jgi:predicted N-acetyltransferase YhbS
MEFAAFDAGSAAHITTLTNLWNAACGPDLALTERGVAFNTQAVTGGSQVGRFALVDGRPVAGVLASTLPGDTAAVPEDMGFIDALVVHPEQQHQGLGTILLKWAEAWLARQGCVRVRTGASIRPFVPGVPVALGTEPFFRRLGYDNPPDHVWDVAADLAEYRSPAASEQPACTVRPCTPGEAPALLRFFQREFPGRWRFEFEESLRHGSRPSDYLVLLTERGIDGFAHTTWEDSYWPLDRVYPHRLPRPWAQLGPLGVSADLRGQGYGQVLIDGALRHLALAGVRGCVIDWTHLVDFYAKFGFAPYRKYVMLQKIMA